MIKQFGRLIINNSNNSNKLIREYCKKIKVVNKSQKSIIINNQPSPSPSPSTSSSTSTSTLTNKPKKKLNNYIIKDKQYESYNNSWFDFKGFERIPVISSGIISLDYQLKIGGIPLNHIIEIYGDSSTGKSTLSMFLISNLNSNDNVLYIDSENSFNSEWASKIGVNLKNCRVFQPNNSEQVFELIKESLKNKLFKVIILDSISSIMSKKEIETNLIEQSNDKENNNNKKPKSLEWLSSNLKEISDLMINTNCSFIFTNQMRYSFNKDDKDDDDDISSNNSNNQNQFQLTTFANSTLNKWVDIAIELKKDRFLLDNSNNIIGIKTFLNIKKNRLLIHDSIINDNQDNENDDDDDENNNDETTSTTTTTINNKLYQNQLINNFQSYFDLNFEKGILKENEENEIKKHLNFKKEINSRIEIINKLFNK